MGFSDLLICQKRSIRSVGQTVNVVLKQRIEFRDGDCFCLFVVFNKLTYFRVVCAVNVINVAVPVYEKRVTLHSAARLQ